MKNLELNEKDHKALIELLRELSEDYSIRNEYGNSYDNYYMEYDCNENYDHPDNLNMRAKELLTKIK